ncbi:MAG TPA: GGDEF domain-containing protein [Gaiellaceae bacterium]|nr:GGDEF domain-containing protein [Gaiellaceae bacterium]
MAKPSVEELAAAGGAADLFLFRRIGDRRFAHIGGAGRGAGWAGIVEVGVAEEPFFSTALDTRRVTRRALPDLWHVFGPYYARAVALVPLSQDVFVVFGTSVDGKIHATDATLLEVATDVADGVSEVDPAKRLADELEVVSALRDLLLAPAGTFDEALHSVVAHATASLSCDLGVLYSQKFDRVAICDKHGAFHADEETTRAALDAIARHGDFPVCIQDASARELPAPFSAADGAIAYYLLELGPPAPGFLLLLHTAAAPRGFTLLCQSLGERLVEAAGPFLSTALGRDRLRHDLERVSGEARRDQLTGVANRLAWDEAVSERVEVASVVLIDCRGLKRTNDTHGHLAGDRLLCRVAEVIASAVRGADLVARIGGDEFAILLRGADRMVATMIVERIEAAIEAEPPVDTVEVAVAIGHATTEDGDLYAAFGAADARMRAAKQEAVAVANCS